MRAARLAMVGIIGLFCAAPASAVTVDFNGIAPTDSYVDYGNGPLTLSGATFTTAGTGDMFVVDPGYYFSAYANGGFLNIDYGGATNTLSVTLPSGMRVVSFDFGGLLDGGTVTASVSINGGASATISSSKSIVGTESLDHFTFSSLVDITTLTFALPDAPQYNALDNFSFTASIPEPSTWAMLLIGFASLGLISSRRKNLTIRFTGV